MTCEGDTLAMQYSLYGSGDFRKAIGEFRFKWDDAAQWFSVEHVQF